MMIFRTIDPRIILSVDERAQRVVCCGSLDNPSDGTKLPLIHLSATSASTYIAQLTRPKRTVAFIDGALILSIGLELIGSSPNVWTAIRRFDRMIENPIVAGEIMDEVIVAICGGKMTDRVRQQGADLCEYLDSCRNVGVH